MSHSESDEYHRALYIQDLSGPGDPPPLPRVRLSSGILTPCNALQESVMLRQLQEEEQEQELPPLKEQERHEQLPLLEEQEQAAGGGAGVFGEASAAALRGQAA